MNFIRRKDTLINLDKVIFIHLIQCEVDADIEFVYEVDNYGNPTKTAFIHYDNLQAAKEAFENLHDFIKFSDLKF